MKTIKKVSYTVVYVDYIPKELEEGVVYVSEEYEVSAHNCLCGCGCRTILPINNKKETNSELRNHGWELIKEVNGTVSFTPSIGNFQLPCKSHYIMTKNIANFV